MCAGVNGKFGRQSRGRGKRSDARRRTLQLDTHAARWEHKAAWMTAAPSTLLPFGQAIV